VLLVTTAVAVYGYTRYGVKQGMAALAANASLDKPSKHTVCSQSVRSEARLVPECLAPTGASRLVLWGDSFADHWAPTLEAWHSIDGPLKVEQLTKNGCPPLLGLLPTKNHAMTPTPYETCREFNHLVIDRLVEAGAVERSGVVLSSNWWYRAPMKELAGSLGGEGYHTFDIRASTRQHSLEALETGLRASLREIEANGLRTLIVLQSPILKHPAPACAYLNRLSACSSSADEHRMRSSEINKTIHRVASEFPGVRTWDPTVALCREGACPPIIDGTIAYTDNQHLSSTMSRSLAARMGPDLEWLVKAR
jgi:hypothetical protein